MASKSSLIISYTDNDSGKTQQKSITDINPQASSTYLKTWGEMTMALTDDTYSKATRIDRTELEELIDRTVTLYYNNGSGTFLTVPDSGIVNYTAAQVSAQTIHLELAGAPDTLLQVSIVDSDTVNPLGLYSIGLNGEAFPHATRINRWGVVFQTTPKGAIGERTIKVTFKLAADNQYKTYEKTITVNVAGE